MTQELVTGSMGRLLGSCFVALWACALMASVGAERDAEATREAWGVLG